MKMIYCRLIIVNDFGWNSCLIWRLVKLQLNVKHHNQCSLILMPTRRECIYTSMNVSFFLKSPYQNNLTRYLSVKNRL